MMYLPMAMSMLNKYVDSKTMFIIAGVLLAVYIVFNKLTAKGGEDYDIRGDNSDVGTS